MRKSFNEWLANKEQINEAGFAPGHSEIVKGKFVQFAYPNQPVQVGKVIAFDPWSDAVDIQTRDGQRHEVPPSFVQGYQPEHEPTNKHFDRWQARNMGDQKGALVQQRLDRMQQLKQAKGKLGPYDDAEAREFGGPRSDISKKTYNWLNNPKGF